MSCRSVWATLACGKDRVGNWGGMMGQAGYVFLSSVRVGYDAGASAEDRSGRDDATEGAGHGAGKLGEETCVSSLEARYVSDVIMESGVVHLVLID